MSSKSSNTEAFTLSYKAFFTRIQYLHFQHHQYVVDLLAMHFAYHTQTTHDIYVYSM